MDLPYNSHFRTLLSVERYRFLMASSVRSARVLVALLSDELM